MTMTSIRLRRDPNAFRSCAALLCALALGAGGCAERRPPDELAQAVTMGERPVAMQGSQTFFGGRVATTVTISRGIGKGFSGGNQHKRTKLTGSSATVGLPGTVGGGNGMIGQGVQGVSGGGSAGAAIGGPPTGPVAGMPDAAGQMPATRTDLPDIGGMEQEEAEAYIKAKVAIGSPLPPVTLHLRIENLSGEKLAVEIDDFSSDLGNFAVQPGTLVLEPLKSGEPDPMISQLGVTSDEIPVRVTLKMGKAKETHTVLVRSLSSVQPTR